jgi:hypothetical protein
MEQAVSALASTATGSQPVGKAIGMVADITLNLLPAPKWAAAIWAVVTYVAKPSYVPFGTYIFMRKGSPKRFDHDDRDYILSHLRSMPEDPNDNCVAQHKTARYSTSMESLKSSDEPVAWMPIPGRCTYT